MKSKVGFPILGWQGLQGLEGLPFHSLWFVFLPYKGGGGADGLTQRNSTNVLVPDLTTPFTLWKVRN